MTMMRGSFSQLVAPGVRKYYKDEYDAWTEVFPKLVNVNSSTKAYETDYRFAGLPSAVKKNEGEAITMAEPVPGWTKTYTHETWGLGFSVTEEMYKDDQSGKVKELSSQLALSMRVPPEQAVANIFNRAWTAAYTGPDGKVLAATDHPYIRGGTYANTPTVQSALSPTSLKAALLYFKKLQNHNGFYANVMPKTLLIPPALSFTAEEIMKTAGVPYSSDNTTNVLKGTLQIVVDPFLTSDTAWFVLGDRHDINFFWREKPMGSPKTWDDEATGNANFKNSFRFSCGFGDALAVWANQGA